jgi:uncharacterized membrane protein YkoI
VQRMMKSVSMAIFCGILAGAQVPAFAYTGEELAGTAKISLDQARAIALRAVRGTISKLELEKEAGGSGLRYSFVIRKGARDYEVGIDAQTGAVLENQPEGKNPD